MTESKETKTIQIDLPEWEYRALCVKAAVLGMSIPRLVCEIIANWAGHTISKEEAK